MNKLACNKEKTNEEVWKDVVGYEGSYQVSSEGRIRSLDRIDSAGKFLTGKIMKQRKNNCGYYQIGLVKNGKQKRFSIHRLVAIAFIENQNPEKFNVIDHINGIRDDNRVENLRWIDSRENVVDGNRRRLDELTSEYEGVSWSKKTGKWNSKIRFNNKRYHLGYFSNEQEAHRSYLIALDKGVDVLEAEQIEKEKIKGIIYYKKNDSYYCQFGLNCSIFLTKKVKTFEEAFFMKREILKDFSNINKYRQTPYNLKEELNKLDINKLKKHKHFESFKHLLEK